MKNKGEGKEHPDVERTLKNQHVARGAPVTVKIVITYRVR